MGKTSIEWCDFTFNAWIGCAKVGRGCESCYAEVETFTRVQRGKGRELWGRNAARHVTGDAYWRQPLKWQRDALRDFRVGSERPRVFCGSMCDVFEDRPDLMAPRARLAELIDATPALDWLLLSKRHTMMQGGFFDSWRAACAEAHVNRYQQLPGGHVDSHAGWGECSCHLARAARGYAMPNVWRGRSASTQAEYGQALRELADTEAAVRFVSLEPLIEPVDLCLESYPAGVRPDWVIVGGESSQDGKPARVCCVDWIRSIVEQCKAAEVAVFVKQLGSSPMMEGYTCHECGAASVEGDSQAFELCDEATIGHALLDVRLRHRKGGDLSEWPSDVQVRDFPSVRTP